MAFDKSAAPQKNRKRRKVCQFKRARQVAILPYVTD